MQLSQPPRKPLLTFVFDLSACKDLLRATGVLPGRCNLLKDITVIIKNKNEEEERDWTKNLHPHDHR